MSAETKPRGICLECGQNRQLTKAGILRDHVGNVRVDRWRRQCPGSGQPPRCIVADPITAAEERGYARAIADLRARADQLAEYDAGYASCYADYLESIAPGRTTP